ncbi:MAG: acyl-phosphate glycerol 3-phosphate acyltransferase [Candidatus Fraserbacteria bacterium RBG_16_55_9]|uniref:Glycerol-3-phosphate acyltransferase n=1 Tax=Fraserbacteria sp. (strain RBG_16_55_9) TaxID=1817864 RepID=A0A1F5UR05_FRAXR|nr:MAG: acyl-phosphate glycerol 3-phosphate acyltransferase [Candidatus Fraserbacteria bacterium RBG_16_55_9]
MFSYLLGSVPFSYFIAKARGVPLQRVGSGNVGATNVARSVGLPYGLLALALDAAKGALSAYLAMIWSLPIWLSVFSVAGHNWSIFLHFKSGKGVATSLGILLAISWPALLITLALWGLVAWATRYVSIASVAALLASPFCLMLWGTTSPEAIGLMAGLAALSAFQHRENLQRLLRGEEHKLS